MNNIIVDDGFNTSYIDSLLIALFYIKKNNIFQNMLSDLPEQIPFAYLQDLIQNNFIEQIRKGYMIDITITNEIRNYSIICGWKDSPSITESFNVVDYLGFLTTGFGFKLKYEIMEKKGETIISKNINHINVKLISDDMRIDELLRDWVKDTFNDKLWNFKEIPIMIPIYLDRLKEDKWNNNKVDIMKRIMFDAHKDYSWVIHAIVGVSNKRYYSIINYDTNWYMFSNNRIPAFTKLNIKTEDISDKIKHECVLIIYRLDKT